MVNARKHIFITGGRGYIGSALVTSLRHKHDLSLLTRSLEENQNGVAFIHGSLETIDTWKERLRNVDSILHLAGVTHARTPTEYQRTNVEGTRKLVRAAEEMGVRRFIFVSTRAIGPACGVYGASKQAAEELLGTSTLDWEILRVAETYDDTWSSSEGINKLARSILRFPVIPIIADTSITLRPIHRDDVVTCLDAMITAPHPKTTYTLAGPEALTLHETAQRITRHLRKHRILVPIPRSLAHLMQRLTANIGIGYKDQWDRLICHKDGLSDNIKDNLGVEPRAFLAR